MGIDVYARWDGQTADERKAQITGFNLTSGAVGYLREAYHGDPYATIWLAPEAFALNGYEDARRGFGGGVDAMMSTIREAIGGGSVTLEPEKIASSCDGFPPEGYLVEAERLEITDPLYPGDPESCAAIPADVLQRRLPLCAALNERRYADDPELAAQVNESYGAFVALIARLESEGKRPGIYASW